MHFWGDEWFEKNGKDFADAVEYADKHLRVYGRMNVYVKEKYGTLRVQGYLSWDGMLHSLIYPGHPYIRFPQALYFLDRNLFFYIFKFTGFRYTVRAFQRAITNYTFQKLCKKYPHMINEIMDDICHYDSVKPGIFGNMDGKEIRAMNWRSL